MTTKSKSLLAMVFTLIITSVLLYQNCSGTTVGNPMNGDNPDGPPATPADQQQDQFIPEIKVEVCLTQFEILLDDNVIFDQTLPQPQWIDLQEYKYELNNPDALDLSSSEVQIHLQDQCEKSASLTLSNAHGEFLVSDSMVLNLPLSLEESNGKLYIKLDIESFLLNLIGVKSDQELVEQCEVFFPET